MKHKLRNLITLCLISLIKLSVGQVGEHQKVILKNGSEYKGILLQNTNDTIRLLTEEDHILQFTTTEVSTVESASRHNREYITASDSRKWYSTTNFFTDLQYFEGFSLGLETFVGIKHHNYFQSGIGIGIQEDWSWNDFEPFIGHITIQNRANLFKSGSTPFISYEPSLIIPIKNNRRESSVKPFGHNLELGYRFYRPKKGHSFNISAGVRRRMNEYFEYIPSRPGRYESIGFFPTYTMVMKLGWQL